MISLQNEARHGDIFDNWTVRLDGVLLVQTPSFKNASETFVGIRNCTEKLEHLTQEAAADLFDELRFGLQGDTARAVAAAQELVRLTTAFQSQLTKHCNRD